MQQQARQGRNLRLNKNKKYNPPFTMYQVDLINDSGFDPPYNKTLCFES